MAKQRKPPKNEGAKPDTSSEAVVLHQKLCLSVDIDNRRIYGSVFLDFSVSVLIFGFLLKFTPS